MPVLKTINLYPRKLHNIVIIKDASAPKFAQSVGGTFSLGPKTLTINDATATLIKNATPLIARNLRNC